MTYWIGATAERLLIFLLLLPAPTDGPTEGGREEKQQQKHKQKQSWLAVATCYIAGQQESVRPQMSDRAHK